MNAFLTCLADYSTDNRGDVGSWVSVRVHVTVHTRVRTHDTKYVSAHICIYACTHACLHACMRACICICAHTFSFVYLHASGACISAFAWFACEHSCCNRVYATHIHTYKMHIYIYMHACKRMRMRGV